MIVNKPPMGWNTWNTFMEDIDEEKVKASADALAASGLDKAGYNYLVIDDGWSEKRRDSNGIGSGQKTFSQWDEKPFGLCSLKGIKVRYVFRCRKLDLRTLSRKLSV